MNPKAPDYANYDEAKATPYSELPDPLVMKNKRKVATPRMRQDRRREIVEDFEREVYGRVPKRIPKGKWGRQFDRREAGRGCSRHKTANRTQRERRQYLFCRKTSIAG